jgi:peroxiredoxin
MNDRLALPFETWNFSHNRNYLCYIQEQLGMADAAIRGGRDLTEAPVDPDRDDFDSFNEGVEALVRALVKFERWREILAPGSIPWRGDNPKNKRRAFVEGLAMAKLGRLESARDRYGVLKDKESGSAISDDDLKDPKNQNERVLACAILSGLGRADEGEKLLEQSVEEQRGRSRRGGRILGDPPTDAIVATRVLADSYVESGRPEKAIPLYSSLLNQLPNDGFSLAGLAVAYAKSGNDERARHYAGRLRYVWSNADPDLVWLRRLKEAGLGGERPIAETPAQERQYDPKDLDRIGPSNWRPYPAPKLECKDPSGKTVRLTDFRGKNVLLVFYLSDECVHCMEQLLSIDKESAKFEDAETVVLAVSSAPPKRNRESMKLGSIKAILLSDTNHENARRFASYDDFEAMELHSTILIDSEGRVRWKRTGGDPFQNVGFLFSELKRINGDGSAKSPSKK